MKNDLAVIITAHKEAELIYPTFKSALKAVERLQDAFDIKVGFHLYLDNSDSYTLEVAEDLAAQNSIEIIKGSNGDPGLSRLSAINSVDSDYVALLDGDDLWSDNWLTLCFQKMDQLKLNEKSAFVLHPEYNLIFGAHNLLVRQGDIEGNWFDTDFLRVANYWDALCFAPRKVFLETPYIKNDVNAGFAHEDYLWMCETLSKNIQHLILKDAVHFKRRRSGSVSQVAEEKKVKVMFNEFSVYGCDK